MTVLSIQSHVAFGYAGNTAAVFPLQRLGHEVYPVLTVTFSNHTGYGSTRGPLIAPADVEQVLLGIQERGAFPGIDAVLSGYLGAREMGEIVLDAVRRVKRANPNAVYCCDPVMGDVGRGFFVAQGIPQFLRDSVLPKADLATPNQFELEFLAGREIRTQADLLEAVATVRKTGPDTVLVTSVVTEDTPTGSISMACVSDDGAWLVTTPMLDLVVRGGGDATAAIFLAHWLSDGPRAALSRTAASMYAVLSATVASGQQEMALVAEQDSIAHPDEVFDTVPL
ncbi:MAG: pyridoxal kinase PdxY [Candidatus Phosphoribacter sp.]